MSVVHRLKAYEYTQVLDNNTSNTFTLLGPLSFTPKEHHHVLHNPKKCIVVPPNHFVTIDNPVVHDNKWEEKELNSVDFPFGVVSGNPTTIRVPLGAKCLMGKKEIRFSQAPFPLIDSEVSGAVQPMPLLSANDALVLEATEDFEEVRPDKTKVKRNEKDRFLFRGPGLYTPQLREKQVGRIKATTVAPNEALHLQVKQTFTDDDGVVRVEGTEWTEKGINLYFIHPFVKLVKVIKSFMLDSVTALKVTALDSFFDETFKVQRNVGDQWLVQEKDVKGEYLPSHMENVQVMELITLTRHQYCVVHNPYKDGKVQRGTREIRTGPCSFFLQPEEILAGRGKCDAYILSSQEALLVKARETFTDDNKQEHGIGSRWLVRGPCSYIPPLEVQVLERRRMVLLTKNRGVYVRNIRTGIVTSRYGEPFMLSEEEELWEKPVTPLVRRMLGAPRLSLRVEEDPGVFQPQMSAEDSILLDAGTFLTTREEEAHEVVQEQDSDISQFAVVSARAEPNTLIRLYDESKGTSRVVAGPAEVNLEPYEEFTILSLSGGKPKTPGQIYALCLYMGPDYMADLIEIETLDHARLELQLAYNWELDNSDPHVAEIAFTIPDFIGEACKTLASRVRSLIAGKTFDDFHRNSSTLIKQAVFGSSSYRYIEVLNDGEVLYFTANGLRITNVDVQSVTPVDPRTKFALTKSVQLAVEIITKSQENDATHNAMLREQKAKGALELQTIQDKCGAEEQRIKLLGVVVENASIEQIGASKAQALAESEARLVEATADFNATPIRCSAHEAGVAAELSILEKRMNADLDHRKAMNDLEVEKVTTLNDIEAGKHEAIMAALGKETLMELAKAGPELQAKLLGALGLQGFLVTDGSTPINLMNFADQIAVQKQLVESK